MSENRETELDKVTAARDSTRADLLEARKRLTARTDQKAEIEREMRKLELVITKLQGTLVEQTTQMHKLLDADLAGILPRSKSAPPEQQPIRVPIDARLSDRETEQLANQQEVRHEL